MMMIMIMMIVNNDNILQKCLALHISFNFHNSMDPIINLIELMRKLRLIRPTYIAE
jgi:hypothetical protein